MTDQQDDRDAQIKAAFESGDMLTSIALKQQRHREHQARIAQEKKETK